MALGIIWESAAQIRVECACRYASRLWYYRCLVTVRLWQTPAEHRFSQTMHDYVAESLEILLCSLKPTVSFCAHFMCSTAFVCILVSKPCIQIVVPLVTTFVLWFQDLENSFCGERPIQQLVDIPLFVVRCSDLEANVYTLLHDDSENQIRRRLCYLHFHHVHGNHWWRLERAPSWRDGGPWTCPKKSHLSLYTIWVLNSSSCDWLGMHRRLVIWVHLGSNFF